VLGGIVAVFAVITARGPNWDRQRGIREQRAWAEHAAFADGLAERGVIVFGGPIGGGAGDDVALLAINATDERDVHEIFSNDPWTKNGVFRLKEVRPWIIWIDSRSAAHNQG
jgi:uncharacterized protein YciI